MENARQFNVNLYGKSEGEKVKLEVLRGIKRLTIHVQVYEVKDGRHMFMNMVDVEKNLVPELGILALELNEELSSLLPSVRSKNGVLVGALVGEVNSWEGDLRTGDIIVAVNKAPIYDFKSLIDFTSSLESGHICAVHIEREGRFRYVTLEIN